MKIEMKEMLLSMNEVFLAQIPTLYRNYRACCYNVFRQETGRSDYFFLVLPFVRTITHRLMGSGTSITVSKPLECTAILYHSNLMAGKEQQDDTNDKFILSQSWEN